MSQDHLDQFWKCFPDPPAQSAVGDSPQEYLAKLNELCSLSFAWPQNHPTGRLTRPQLRALCRDDEVDVLIAYAAVMAWGGRGVDSRNYRLSLSETSRSAIITVLNKLRHSNSNRQNDFDVMQQAARSIKGLGISFYTKLLFFFREKADAYILDQFTAKSAKVLFSPCEIVLTTSGYPHPDNTPTAYEWFCNAIETLGSSRRPTLSWTGEEVEQAMFDVRGGRWRNHLRSIFGKTERKSVKKPNGLPAISPAVNSVAKKDIQALACGESLPGRILKAHSAAYQAGCELPGVVPQIGASHPVRMHCSIVDGVIWQYSIQRKSIHAEVFVPARHITRYDALRLFMGVEEHDFGDGIYGNGAKNGKTRSLKVSVGRGLDSPQTEWDEIAKQAVSAMSTLFDRVCENL